jgi:two-component system cell cycle sensor histidine kinase PleC
LLFIATLVLASALFVTNRMAQMDREAGLEQARIAQAAAARIDSVLAHAWGAAASAGEVTRFSAAAAADPSALVQAAARARGVEAVALMAPDGAVLASVGAEAPAAGRAAIAAAGAEATWVGSIVTRQAGPPRLALVRRVHAGVMVVVADPELLLPNDAATALVVVDPEGVALASTAEGRSEGLAEALGLASAPASLSGLADVGAAAAGGSVAYGSASGNVGGLTVISARPINRALEQALPALMSFFLLLLAPMVSVGALLLLLRHNAKRAVAAEAEVDRVEAQARLTADGARAGFFEWDLAQGGLHLSEYAAQMLRAAGERISLPEFLALVAADDRSATEEAFRLARRTGALDARFRVGFGPETACIEAHGLGLETTPGAGAQRIVGTVVDVTRRREAEERASALELRLREAISSYSGPFALWDQRRRIVLWNKSFQTVFGLGPDILRPHASHDTVAIAAASQIARERVDPNDPMSREVQTMGGQWFRMVERRTAEGGLVTVGIDVTDMKHQEETLIEKERHLLESVARLEKSEQRNKVLARQAEEERQKAEDASAAKSAFLANMSHELRTPLNAIIGFSEIMMKELMGPIGTEQYKSYTHDIYNSGSHLLDLITDVLDMAKIEAGHFQLTPRPLDPEIAIDQALRLMRRKAEEKGLQLLSDCEELPEIEADHRAVKQMLLNLLSNAVKFTDQGAVMVSARANDWGIEMRVVDSGRGIPKEALPRLARPFEQVDTELNRNTSGTGLGLALTKSLAEMHGGRIEIESELGRGTMVAIHLPRIYAGTPSARDDDGALPHAAE